MISDKEDKEDKGRNTTFPKLMISPEYSGNILLMTNRRTGTVVFLGKNPQQFILGTWSSSWIPDDLEDYNGTVLLEMIN